MELLSVMDSWATLVLSQIQRIKLASEFKALTDMPGHTEEEAYRVWFVAIHLKDHLARHGLEAALARLGTDETMKTTFRTFYANKQQVVESSRLLHTLYVKVRSSLSGLWSISLRGAQFGPAVLLDPVWDATLPHSPFLAEAVERIHAQLCDQAASDTSNAVTIDKANREILWQLAGCANADERRLRLHMKEFFRQNY